MSNVLQVIKKIGEKILSVVEYPIKHSVMVAEMFAEFIKDEPKIKADVVQLVQLLESMGPDLLKALASEGLNIAADAQAGADVQALFTFVTKTMLPDIEDDYADFKTQYEAGQSTASAQTATSDPALVAAASAQDDAQTGPGLHTVTQA